jgi:hypothetical protein
MEPDESLQTASPDWPPGTAPTGSRCPGMATERFEDKGACPEHHSCLSLSVEPGSNPADL